MPFVPNTPESFLGRSDSKDPGSTCCGITSSGRPCRRPIASKKWPATALRPPGVSGTSGRRRASAPDLSDESLYCWQHKDQASHSSARSSPGPRGRVQPILEERSSLDTLADRLGLVQLHEKTGKVSPPAQKESHRKSTSGRRHHVGSTAPKPPQMSRPAKPARTLDFCFCFSIPIEEVPESPRRPRPQPHPIQQYDSASVPVTPQKRNHRHSTFIEPSPGKVSIKSASSQTAQLKHLIPDTVDAPTASALMTELARPFAESEEPGYIYMFWLTPSSQTTPPPIDAARSLLAPPSPSGQSTATRTRRASDIVSSFGEQRETMLLKIGRAANVQRRMNQWQRQCGYDIEVLRYYPYISSPASPSGLSKNQPATTGTPRTTPHCRRVERLVHIELAGLGLRVTNMGACGVCGRDHREWFQVKSTREGIRQVDEVVRRWVAWDESNGDQ